MTSTTRRGIVLATVVAMAGLPTGAAGAQAEPVHASDPCQDLEPGAASPEPTQEIEEEVHDAAQQAWIEGIWSAP